MSSGMASVSSSTELRIKVVLLNNEHILLSYHSNSLVEDIFHEVCCMLDLEERELFGLAVSSDECYLFLDPAEKLSKVDFSYLNLPRKVKKWDIGRRFRTSASASVSSWRGSGRSFTSQSPSECPTLYFRVRFYIPIHCLRERSTQHAYYEQLRSNVLEYEIFCPLETYVELAALALQSDIGAAPANLVHLLKAEQQIPSYFQLAGYFPQRLLQEYTEDEVTRLTLVHHVALKQLVPFAAEFRYIRLASKMTSNFNMHLYSLPRMAQVHFDVWLGVSPEGLILHQQLKDGWIRPTTVIRWKEIDRLSYKHRKFMVTMRNNGTTREFSLNCSLTARYLFALASHMHFFQATAELSATHAAGLLEQIERGPYEERCV